MSAKRTSGALMTSLVLHLVLAFLVGIYLITQTPHFQEFIGAEILEPAKPPKPTVREPLSNRILNRLFRRKIQSRLNRCK